MLAGAPTGLFGHVEENRKRSILLFAGFIVAIELMALMLLSMPTLMFDYKHSPLTYPLGYITRYVLPVAVIALIVYAARLWWFVGAVKKAVGFRYVDDADEPRFCRILEPLAITAGIPVPYAAVIDSPALNAFACGVRANHMVVVATRGLIDGLDDDELAAVLAHEIIHIKNRDTMLLASANTFMATLMMARTKRQVKFDDARQIVALVILPVMIPLYLVMAFLTQLAMRIGHCSRAAIGSAREMIADAEAVCLTKNPAALVSALRKIEGRSRIDTIGEAEEAMMIDGPAEGPLATHPTVTERIAALARTTGSMIFDGGTRLDTREPALAGPARSLGFGRRDETLERIATLAEAPPRANLWQIFRRTRDPERNILGFNKRGALFFATMLAIVGGLATTTPGSRFFAGQMGLFFMMGDVGKLSRNLATCNFKAIAGTLDDSCKGEALEKDTDSIFTALGLPPMSGGTFSSTSNKMDAEDEANIASKLRRRCYRSQIPMTPAALTANPQGRGGENTMEQYGRSALRDNDAILKAPPGRERDKALKEYIELRKALLSSTLYFFGKPGFDEMNTLYHREDHRAIITLLAQRLPDPAFTAGENPYEVADYRIFATAPFEALPCDTVPEKTATRAP